jgi:hypothetical protein
MSGVEVAAAVFGVVAGTIDLIHKSIEIYGAVKDKSGIPKALKKVSDKLPSLEELLRGAQAQYKEGKLNTIDKQTWDNAKQEIEQCKELCQELHDLLLSAYPKADAGKAGRLWKGTKTVFSSKGKSAEALLKEICEHLDTLAKHQIINNTALLEEIKSLVQELCPQSTTTSTQSINGDIRGDITHTHNGDKVGGDKFGGDKFGGDKFGGDKVQGNKDSHVHHHQHGT